MTEAHAEQSLRSRLLHDSYLVGLTIQALIGSSQLIAAITLQIAFETGWLARIGQLTEKALAHRPPDPLTSWALQAAHDFSVSTDSFWSIYLFGHGILNLGVVVALLAKRHWAHPVSIVVLSGFIVYQMYRYALTHSLVMIGLSLFDAVVIALVWREYLEIRRGRAS